jgi:transposase
MTSPSGEGEPTERSWSMKSRHRVIDLLPDRKAETAKAWMQAHPEIDLISGDRRGDDASAASQGAPQAAQSADRFH